MTGSCEPFSLRAKVGEALDALGRLDADQLERTSCSCENWLREREPAGLDREHSDIEINGSGEIGLFARLLETTKANIGLICQSRLMSSVQLEYVPGAGRRECGALD
jgi:hypothetical protein